MLGHSDIRKKMTGGEAIVRSKANSSKKLIINRRNISINERAQQSRKGTHFTAIRNITADPESKTKPASRSSDSLAPISKLENTASPNASASKKFSEEKGENLSEDLKESKALS